VTQEWPGLPAGVKFDPSEEQLLRHLAAKVGIGNARPHSLINDFILTLEEVDGICYTHPENLPGDCWLSLPLTLLICFMYALFVLCTYDICIMYVFIMHLYKMGKHCSISFYCLIYNIHLYNCLTGRTL
jgi:hypothetical protein